MASQSEIKKVTEENFSLLIKLINQFAKFENEPFLTNEKIFRLKEDCLKRNPRFEAYLAYKNNKPIAFMIILMTYSSFLALPTLYIEDLYIIEEERRKGTGQIFFDYAKGLAEQRNCGRMEWIALHWNTPAIKFYEKNNAQLMKDIVLYRVELGSV